VGISVGDGIGVGTGFEINLEIDVPFGAAVVIRFASFTIFVHFNGEYIG